MKNFCSRLLVVLPFFLVMLSVPSKGQNIRLTSQEQVNNFQSTTVEGNLTVTGEDIVNLDGLSELVEVKGDIAIRNNPNLIDVNGLASLVSSGSLDIVDNSSLINISLEKYELSSDRVALIRNNSLVQIDFM